MQSYSYCADARRLGPSGGENFASEKPDTGEIRAQLSRCNRNDADIAVQAAYRAYPESTWGRMNPAGRDEILNYTRLEPDGEVAAISAWNSPLLIAIKKLAPTLAAGNTVVLKPSKFASASTLELTKAFEDADLPSSVINTVTGCGAEVGEPPVIHELLRQIDAPR